ncbi:hypothetical protein [Edaphosphingomonas haloaromaticamans]|uniref:Phage shock protein B n=1 Tax=Edaphosphingomonas haloaromaticamans TaxID=653954 RepID=A0A1S1HF41_9SPHN|nr:MULTISPECIES: hypothetical protein [Sphingomonas]MDX3883548.1 hypothetical protein [Sphingomonas sp.]OHT20835.1 hypothetical protein BHE75_02838 [Sphingomonas haloaromaticamans]
MFDNPFSMVVAIVLIVSIAGIMRAKYGVRRDRHGNELPIRDPDADRLRDELKALKERVAVLERIATENNRGVTLDREIEALRHRD